MTVEDSRVASSRPQATRRGKADLALPYALATIGGALPVFISPDQLWSVPIIAMIMYLAFGLTAARKQGRTLEFADSFYYLGFTLTIASLLSSLKPFGGGAKVQPAEVLQLFGLGLFTTLIGVVGRTVLQMFYRTPGENIEATNQKIEVIAAQYLSNLEVISSRSTEMLTTGLGVLERDLQGTLANVKKSLSALDNNIQEAVQKLGRVDLNPAAMQAAIDTMTTTITSSNEGLKAHIGELKELGAQVRATGAASEIAISQARKAVADAMESLKQHADTAAVSIGNVAKRLETIQLEPERMNAAFDRLGNAIDFSAQQVVSKLGTTADASSNLAQQLKVLAERVAGVDLARVGNAVSSLTARIDGLASALDGGASSLTRESLESLSTSLRQTSDQARQMNVVVDEILAAVRLKLEQIK